MEIMIIFIFTIITAFLINVLVTPLIVKLSHSKKWYDKPDYRKIHTGLIPRIGGIGVFLSIIVCSLLFSTLLSLFSQGSISGILQLKYAAVIGAFVLIHILGLMDDFKSLPALAKLTIQAIAAIMAIASGLVIKEIPLPYLGSISLGFLSYPLTFIWIIGITNAMNLVDGMDGLAGGIAAFASLSMGIISLLSGQWTTAVISLSVFGATAGFLVFNLPPAKIFMGDSGSLSLGYILSVLPLMGLTTSAETGSIFIPITLLMIPIIDMAAAIIRRLGEGRPILSPDRKHIHHKLLDIGLPERRILLLIYSICLYLSVMAITSVVMPKEANVYLMLFVWIGVLMGYGFITYVNARKENIAMKQEARQKNSA
ncbi:MAG: undecaprenyl/decaprenyl-phosphate alpha-N-acetylglucosaminyl 1-phosphate transferase [Spirochaetales bacterium]|nr:undecaprenyl/decaprenyl-phosphate alpha-N-acetylglucosaminyl 1-phosphate transferase [Spirochaetales bacterium]